MSYDPIGFETDGLASVRKWDKNSERLPGATVEAGSAAGSSLGVKVGESGRSSLEWFGDQVQIFGKKVDAGFYPARSSVGKAVPHEVEEER